MKKVIKGMLITEAPSYETLLQIAETIKINIQIKELMKSRCLSIMKIMVVMKKNYYTNRLVKEQ